MKKRRMGKGPIKTSAKAPSGAIQEAKVDNQIHLDDVDLITEIVRLANEAKCKAFARFAGCSNEEIDKAWASGNTPWEKELAVITLVTQKMGLS